MFLFQKRPLWVFKFYVLLLSFPPGGEETLAERSLSCASAAQLRVFYGWMDWMEEWVSPKWIRKRIVF